MITGILLGLATALLQSLSYLTSAFFIKKHGSAFQLLLLSQAAMGAMSVMVLPFFFPVKIFDGTGKPLFLLGIWIIMFCLGQAGFFLSQKIIESSRLASMLGLKIVVLALIWIFFYRRELNLLQISGALLSVIAAFAMNWSGGKTFGFKGGAALAMTLFCFSMTDLSETEMVLYANDNNIVRAGISTTLLCYTVLGALSLPLLWKCKWRWQKQCDVLPFSVLWLVSQITLLICFGMIGPVFGNVIQSSRGIFSVVFGALICRTGMEVMENRCGTAFWVRRALAALLMAGGIACFSFGKIIH